MIAVERRSAAPAVDRPADEQLGGARGWTAFGAAVILLSTSALAELLLARIFYRVGVYIPRQGPFRGVYRVLTAGGSFALDLSSVLTVFVLVLLAVRGLRGEGKTAGIALVGFLAAWALVRLGGVETLGPAARLTFSLAVLALVAPFLRSGAHPFHRAAVAGVAACFLLSAYTGVAAEGERLAGVHLPGGLGAQLLAEGLVVVAAALMASAWIATDGFRPGPAIVAAPIAATLLALWTASGAITAILVLWTAGLRLFLPVWLYSVALGAVLAAAIGWLPRFPWRSAGLALLLVAGLLLGNTYLQALGLVALALLSDGRAVGGVPALRRS